MHMTSSKEQNSDKKKLEQAKSDFKPKKYPRPWEIELTDEQRNNLKKKIEEDTKRYKELGKRITRDNSLKEIIDKK